MEQGLSVAEAAQRLNMSQGTLAYWATQARKGMKLIPAAGSLSPCELAAEKLISEGFVAGRDRIARLRGEEGLRCIQKRKFKATTNSNYTLPVAENLLGQRDLNLRAPMRRG